MQYKDVEVGSIVYFWFAANLTTGEAGDGATPLYDVRLAGAAANAIPTASGTPTLLTHGNYTDGLHEIAIDTTGYAVGEYAVFCTLTISAVTPAGLVGSFKVVAVGDSLHSAAARIMDNLDATITSRHASGAAVAKSPATLAPADVTGNLPSNVLAWNAGALPTVGDATAANQAAIAAYIDTEVGAIKAKTDNLPSDPADQSAVEAAITAATSGLATAANLATVAGYLDTEITSILGYVDCLPATWVTVLDAAGVRTALGLATGNLDAQLAALPTAQAILDKVNTTLELDGAVYRFTINALEQAPAGGGGGGSCQWSPTQRDIVLSQVGRIGVSAFEVRSPLTPDARSMQIVQGDDYTVAILQPIELIDSNDVWPAFVELTLGIGRGGVATLELTDGVIDDTGLHKIARWEMSSVESLLLTQCGPRAYAYKATGIMATGERRTFAVGQVDVLPFQDP
jgi:hypothetical protein